MPEPCDLSSLKLPENSEVQALLETCNDIDLLRFSDEEFLIRADETSQDIFLILRGGCLVEHPDAPLERTPGSELAIIEGTEAQPVFVGEMAYFGTGRRTASVRSTLNTKALRLQPGHLDVIIQQFPWLTRILCGQFTKRLQETNELLNAYKGLMTMEADNRFLSPGDVVFKAGDPPDSLCQLVSGTVVLEREGVEEEVVSSASSPAFLEPGAFFLGEPHGATATAKSAVILAAVSARSRLAAARNFPEQVLGVLERVRKGEGKMGNAK